VVLIRYLYILSISVSIYEIHSLTVNIVLINQWIIIQWKNVPADVTLQTFNKLFLTIIANRDQIEQYIGVRIS